MPTKEQHIAIIGAGTTGLATALFLNQVGIKVTLFERFATPHPIGAGLLLQPTGLAALSKLGLLDDALSLGAKVERLYGQTAHGKRIFDLYYRDLSSDWFGLGIHRGSLFHLLYQAVKAKQIPIITDCDIVAAKLWQDKRLIQCVDGNELGSFDCVIDASGVQSKLRDKYATIKLNCPYPFGAVWGVCSDTEQAFAQQQLQQRYQTTKIMAGVLPIGYSPDKNHKLAAFFWSLPCKDYDTFRCNTLDKWRAQVLDVWPEVEPLVTQFDSVDKLTFAHYSDVVLKQFIAKKIVFIGDAGHSMSPQLGQGANLGLMDAMTLGDCLQSTNNIDDALIHYQKIRQNHVWFYQRVSRCLTPFFQSDSPLFTLLRDHFFGPFTHAPFLKKQALQTLCGVKSGVFSHIMTDIRASF